MTERTEGIPTPEKKPWTETRAYKESGEALESLAELGELGKNLAELSEQARAKIKSKLDSNELRWRSEYAWVTLQGAEDGADEGAYIAKLRKLAGELKWMIENLDEHVDPNYDPEHIDYSR